MKIFADLHVHSSFSRGTSTKMNLKNIEKYSRIKGINLVGTGDFTHPKWFNELKKHLKEDGTGILKSETNFNFILQTEISLIYTQDKKTRKIHIIILAPSFEIVEQINAWLKTKGRLDYDGRPIFGFSCIELVENLMNISKDILIIPAHAWTPWFGLYGSNSGFDSIKDCFQEQLKYIFAIETGLSSDPAMNWRLSELDNIALISNSDAHSFWPWRIGREANVFQLEHLSYKNIVRIIKERDKKRFLYTIEVNPAYGKYHLDGHRQCNVFLEPKEAIKMGNICPVCRKPLTIGVLHRVETLADRPEGFKPKNAIPFKSVLPLSEIISYTLNTQPHTKKVWEIYNNLIKAFGSEFTVVLETGKKELKETVDEKIAENIIKVREGKIKVQAGYDGVYGYPIFDGKAQNKTNTKNKQTGIDKFLR